jgi:hypothetical protein
LIPLIIEETRIVEPIPFMTSEPLLLESEISNLLGSIKIRASGIKATLKKTKSKFRTKEEE